MGSASSMLWSTVFGAIGFGYFLYGKKQKHIVALSSGIGLMLFPYFVENTLAMVGIGAALMVLPKFVKL